jgi:hypothetical protein
LRRRRCLLAQRPAANRLFEKGWRAGVGIFASDQRDALRVSIGNGIQLLDRDQWALKTFTPAQGLVGMRERAARIQVHLTTGISMPGELFKKPLFRRTPAQAV